MTISLKVTCPNSSEKTVCKGMWIERISEDSDEMFYSQVFLQPSSDYFLSETSIYDSVAFFSTVCYYVASLQARQLKTELLLN